MRVRAKICGITRLADAHAAVAAGADALGFNFYPRSPRYVRPESARAIIDSLPPLITSVGLFVDEDPAEVRRVAAVAGIDLAQFHGDETDATCSAAGLPYVKVVPVNGPIDAAALERQFPQARGFLLDTWSKDARGGTGRSFDWSLWPQRSVKPLMLAGGLSPDNVATAIAHTRPYAVDVSSGVEAGVPGEKDPAKIEAFMREVRRAQRRD